MRPAGRWRSAGRRCQQHSPGTALGFEVYSDQGELRIDVGDPDRSAEELFGPELAPGGPRSG